MIVGGVSVVIKVLNAEKNLNYVCGFNSNRSVNTLCLGYENRPLLCRKIIAPSSEIYANLTNALCGQNTEMLNVKSGT
jgi:hypothetical protein